MTHSQQTSTSRTPSPLPEGPLTDFQTTAAEPVTAYAPNGQRITHEYWLEPQTAPVTFWRGPVNVDEAEDHHRIGAVTALTDETDGSYDVEQKRDGARVLRWQAADGSLWADEELIFRTDGGQRVDTDLEQLAVGLFANRTR